jgi:hypothetical protein
VHRGSSSFSHSALDTLFVEGSQLPDLLQIRGSALDFEACCAKSLDRSQVERNLGFASEYFSSVFSRIYSPLHSLCRPLIVCHRSSQHEDL